MGIDVRLKSQTFTRLQDAVQNGTLVKPKDLLYPRSQPPGWEPVGQGLYFNLVPFDAVHFNYV
ncbi:hypothetical protein [Nostoc sp. DedQUE09]|uniref:hypothetical protein n=1 Tax=Nostoc sp. DedQUE09 TaxID=3075394 RepID=UPI002AD2AF02|nr:hypothetical protein [Nostoc sp. DedQUE09]MDZ7953681.1 hypothetical protein [Nostoc sp. DedQUE09]